MLEENKVKKIFAYLLAVCLCVGLMSVFAGCSNNTPAGNTTATTEPTQETTESTQDTTQESTSDVDVEVNFGDLP